MISQGGQRKPARVLIIGINYRPELTPIDPYTAGIADAPARHGDRVTILTGLLHYRTWRIATDTSRRPFASTDVHGVRVLVKQPPRDEEEAA